MSLNTLQNAQQVSWQHFQNGPSFAKRTADCHKGHFGHVMIVGGDLGMGGAVSLAAAAALRSGAGLVSVATRPEHVSAILARHPEVMVHGVGSGQDLQPLLARAQVIVIGPGLGQSYWGEQLLQQVFALTTPVVLDADALHIMAKGRVAHNLAARVSVMTPHAGEAAHLLYGNSLADGNRQKIQDERLTSVTQLAHKYSSSVVLKGMGSLICSEQQLSICGDGNPGMASAGMGDVLSGIMGSLLAQQVANLPQALHEVACAAVCLHSAAADEAAKEGQAGMVATDVIQQLRTLLR